MDTNQQHALRFHLQTNIRCNMGTDPEIVVSSRLTHFFACQKRPSIVDRTGEKVHLSSFKHGRKCLQLLLLVNIFLCSIEI